MLFRLVRHEDFPSDGTRTTSYGGWQRKMEEGPTTQRHKKEAPDSVGFGVLVISTGVFAGRRRDSSGEMIAEMIRAAGHKVLSVRLVPDAPPEIRKGIEELADLPGVQVIVSTGGTGLSPSDLTVETVRVLFQKEITGFLPLFMLLSYEDVGAACMLSRTTAGILRGPKPVLLFALPGSPKACRLALEKLVLPEASHIIKHVEEI